MKKLGILLTLSLILFGCQANEKKPEIVTTSFVSYDIAKNIVGDTLNVTNIMPWGSELHDFDPSPQNMIEVNEAKLFIYMGDEIETWVDSVTNENVLNLSLASDEDEHTHEHDHEETDEHDHEHEETDEHDHEHEHNHGSHYWTDPMTFVAMIDLTLDKLVELYPEHKDVFTANAKAYIEEIVGLEQDLTSFLKTTDHKTLFFGGHNALDGFAHHFGLKIISLQDSFRPDADVTAQEIIALRDQMEENHASVLFHEELVEPLVARQIQNDLQKQGMEIELLELHGYHNITQEQYEEGITYGDLFKQNITNIKKALGH